MVDSRLNFSAYHMYTNLSLCHRDGLCRCLDNLLRHTAPTALILDHAILLHTARAHLARKGILAPEHVSLVCADPDPAFG